MRQRFTLAIFACISATLLLTPILRADAPRLGVEEPKPKSDGVIRLATYNILNLFDDKDDPSKSGRDEDIDDTKPEDQKAAVARAIRRMDADVIGLQEIESYDALIEFREEYLQGLGYDHVASIDVGQSRGIEQSVLSRFPIKEATVWPHMELGGVHPEMYGDKPNYHAGEPILCRRSPLRVIVEVPADHAATGDAPYQLTLFVIHHKSGRYNDYWRNRETARLVEMIKAYQSDHPQANIAVIGDFNAQNTDWSVRGYFDGGLTDVFGNDRVPDKMQLTHESGRCIDFILVNDQLMNEIKPDSAFVLGTPVRGEREAARYWEHDPPAGYASDHMPVCVDITPREK